MDSIQYKKLLECVEKEFKRCKNKCQKRFKKARTEVHKTGDQGTGDSIKTTNMNPETSDDENETDEHLDEQSDSN